MGFSWNNPSNFYADTPYKVRFSVSQSAQSRRSTVSCTKISMKFSRNALQLKYRKPPRNLKRGLLYKLAVFQLVTDIYVSLTFVNTTLEVFEKYLQGSDLFLASRL